MKFHLSNWYAKSLEFKLDHDSKRKKNMSFSVGNMYPEGENIFIVGFKLKLDNKDFILDTEYLFEFKVVEGEITDEFKTSHFPLINAPAIAYPYLRSFISTITIQSGVAPVVLPTINFVDYNKNKIKKSNKSQKEEQ